MKSAFAIAIEAISLYREYIEQHGYDPERAAAAAAFEVAEGQQALEEMEAMKERADFLLPETPEEESDESLPY